MNDLIQFDTQKIKLTTAINFVSSKDDTDE